MTEFKAFKVGDRVRTLTAVGRTPIGTEGVIASFANDDDAFPIRIDLENNTLTHSRHDDEIELVERDESAPAPADCRVIQGGWISQEMSPTDAESLARELVREEVWSQVTIVRVVTVATFRSTQPPIEVEVTRGGA